MQIQYPLTIFQKKLWLNQHGFQAGRIGRTGPGPAGTRDRPALLLFFDRLDSSLLPNGLARLRRLLPGPIARVVHTVRSHRRHTFRRVLAAHEISGRLV